MSVWATVLALAAVCVAMRIAAPLLLGERVEDFFLLDGSRLSAVLTVGDPLWRSIEVVPATGSTNADLAARALVTRAKRS